MTVACQGFVLVLVGLCPGQHEEPWAHRLMLLEATAGHTNPTLPGESHDTGDMKEMWETPSQILQMFSSRQLVPLPPHLSMLPPMPADVAAGVTLLPSCFSSTCIPTNWSHSNTEPHLLWSHTKAFYLGYDNNKMCSWFLVVQGDPWFDAQDTTVTVYGELISMDVLEEKKRKNSQRLHLWR